MTVAQQYGQRWFLVLSPDGAARTVSMCCAKAFEERFGHDCKIFDSLTYRNAFTSIQKKVNHDLTADLLNQSLVVSCLDFGATHILVMALSPVTVFSLNILRKQGVKTIHWFFEDFRRAPYWKDVLAGYDHFCAIQKGPLPAACKTSGAEYHFLPTAVNHVPVNTPSPATRPYDVGFVGIPSPYRIAVLERLAQNGLALAIGGSGWNSYRGILQKSIVKTTWMDEKDSFGLLAESKIGLNLSVDEPVERDLVHISPRVYDLIIAGCILVSENVPLLSESLSPVEYLAFNSLDDIGGVIEKALAGFGGSEKVSRENRDLVIQNHTYAQRVDQLISFL
jgi:hypothetical protein